MSGTTRRRGPDVVGRGIAAGLIALNLLAGAATCLAAAQARMREAVALPVVLIPSDIAAAWWLRRRQDPYPIDHAARWLSRPSELRGSTTRGAARTAERLGFAGAPAPGVYLGKTVQGKRDLWCTWEQMYVLIGGAGSGKTTSHAIPNIVAAPGAVVVTSCKRDVVDTTRGIRERRGRTWVFDPQNVAGEAPTWFWNPLDMVAASMKEAASVAGLIAFTQRKPHMRTDAYFDSAALTLVTVLLFAASADGRPITDILKWLYSPTDDAPVRIMRATGHDLAAASYEGMAALPGAQRAGVFGAARQYMAWLDAPEIREWITPGEGREQFRFDNFATETTDTLYILSRSDDRTATPAVGTLTAAVVVAAAVAGGRFPGGRLPVPLLVVLDEAANTAPLPIWPNRYSHYGSRGVVIMTMLQSWAQGVAVWGENGMAKLWGAASVRVLGSGGSEAAFLAGASAFSGTFEAPTLTTSGPGTALFGTIGRSSRPEPVLDVSDLGRLPRGRAYVQISGSRPVLVRTIPWWEGAQSAAINASMAKYGL